MGTALAYKRYHEDRGGGHDGKNLDDGRGSGTGGGAGVCRPGQAPRGRRGRVELGRSTAPFVFGRFGLPQFGLPPERRRRWQLLPVGADAGRTAASSGWNGDRVLSR